MLVVSTTIWRGHFLKDNVQPTINEQILSDLEPDQLRYFSESDGSFRYSSQEESGDTQDDGIVELFKEKIEIQIPFLASLNV